jgi:GMP synthase (glutamine-hydrolysing)
MTVWMSHGDKLRNLPEGFHTIGTTKNSEYAAIAHKSDPIYGIQFHPEVTRGSSIFSSGGIASTNIL